jgi:hypothetical protein
VPHSPGELRREVDPTGKIVEHRVRKSSYVHERMHAAGKLVGELYGAAEKFSTDFERAQLSGTYARTDLFRTRAGKGEITDKVAAAKYTFRRRFPESDAQGGRADRRAEILAQATRHQPARTSQVPLRM